uniref:Uncharacterized protein n=1 Tax=Anguilla anguilla TaxID=7936 RepID=A0A0E9UL82_ANGAN
MSPGENAVWDVQVTQQVQQDAVLTKIITHECNWLLHYDIITHW